MTVKKKKTKISCLMIQWEKLSVDKKGNPICPKCKQPAEMILGVFSNPCYAHK